MAQISCYCTPTNSSSCDPITRKIKCSPGVQHCLMVVKNNTENRGYTEHIQDCWKWKDVDRCPIDINKCHSLSTANRDFITCCCKGDLCNHPSNISIVESPHYASNNSLYNDLSLPNFPELETQPLTYASSFDNSIIFCIILLSTVILLFAFMVILFVVYRHYTRTKSHKRKSPCHACQRLSKIFPSLSICFNRRLSFAGGSQTLGDFHQNSVDVQFCPSCSAPNELSSDGFLCAVCGKEVLKSDLPQLKRPICGGGWLAKGEIECLSKICTKIEISSQGRFGEVWRGQMKEPDSNEINPSCIRQVAIKVFIAAEKRSWETELEIYRLPGIQHPNILNYIGVDQVIPDNYKDTNNENEKKRDDCCSFMPPLEYWLVTNFLSLGSVYDYISVNELTWKQMLKIAVGMARGLSHLHTEISRSAVFCGKPSIAHRDFKSRNVLLKPDFTACISDMGLSIRLETGQCIGDAHLQVGTRRYMAPEVLDGAIQFTRDAFLRIDVYALGLVVWELMTRSQASSSDQNHSISLPAYAAPFEAELGPAPTMDMLQNLVAQRKCRPLLQKRWEEDQDFMQLWETVQDSWDQDAEARLTAGCIAERMHNLQRQIPQHFDDQSDSNSVLQSTEQYPSQDQECHLPLLLFK